MLSVMGDVEDLRSFAFSARAAAAAYRVSRHTIRTAIASGELRAARLGKRNFVITRASMEDFLRRHEIASAEPPTAHAVRRIDEIEAREARKENG